jgi:CheY-like chemotaxis protein
VTHKLLLADDSVTIQRVVELTFSGEDVQVVTVGDGEQAMARIPIERPDIVLADIGMPKRSGYDVSAFVKGRPDLAHIPVLLLAGAFEPVDEARAQQVHCDGVLVKPFEPQQVISRVRELVDGSKHRGEHRGEQRGVQTVSESFSASPNRRTATPEFGFSESEPRHATVDVARNAVTLREPQGHTEPGRPHPLDSGLDDYFEHLDAKFAGLGSRPEASAPPPPEIEHFRSDIPTVDTLLGSTPLESSPSVPDSMEPLGREHQRNDSAASVGGGRNVMADMFNALIAMEQGESGAAPVSFAAPATTPPAITDELVDEIARRVAERLAPNTARELVKQIVSEVAERLIRDEIARIKAAVGTRR